MLGRFTVVYDTELDGRLVWVASGRTSIQTKRGQTKTMLMGTIFGTVKDAREHVVRFSRGARWILDLETGKTYSVAQ